MTWWSSSNEFHSLQSTTRRLLLLLQVLFGLTGFGLAHPALTAERTLIVAHRGGAHIGPENRLETFAKAVALGVDGVELDIHLSADGHLMVLHDLDLERSFGVPGKVNQMNLAELKEAGVPTLAEVVDLVDGRCLLFIEIKQPKDGTTHVGIEKRLVGFLRKRKLRDSVVVISFYDYSIAKMEELAPEFVTGFLLSRKIGDLNSYKNRLGVDFIGPRFSLVTPDVLKEAHRLGLRVNPWTVNGPDDLRRFLELGVDGITTNDPDLLVWLAQPWFMSR